MNRPISRPAACAALLAAAVVIVFGVGYRAPFIYDDVMLLKQNPLVTGPWPGLRPLLGYTMGGQGEYEPLVFFGHWLLFRAPAHAVWLCRLTSVLLHALNASLFFFLCRRWLKDDLLALASASLFAFYPGHTEVLAISTFKKHLLVSFFALAILQLRARPHVCWTLQLLALGCKESALMIPALAWLCGRKEDRRLYAGLWGVCVFYAAFRAFVVPRAYPALIGGSWAAHWLTSGKSLLWSLSQFPAPWDLCLEHSLPPVATALEAGLIALGAAIVLGAVFWTLKKDKIAGAGLAWCALFLLPFINLAPFLNYSLVANRYLYMSSAGFFLFALRLAQKADLRRPALALSAAALVFYGALDVKRMTLFVDPLTLWRQVAGCAPQNPRARTALGALYAERRLYEEALAEYRAAKAADPRFDAADRGIAQVYSETGRLKEAIALMAENVKTHPSAYSLRQLGGLYLRTERYARAVEAFDAAIKLDPFDLSLRLDRGACLLAAGRLTEAEAELLLAAQEPANQAKAFKFLGGLYAQSGDGAQAELLYEKSLALDPLQIDAAVNLAKIYAKAKEPEKAARVIDRLAALLEGSIAQAQRRGLAQDQELIKAAGRQLLELRREQRRL